MTSEQYATAVAILFAGYVLMQLPSNVFLAQMRPSWYLPSVMVIWGMLSALVGATHNAGGLYALRFLLGFVEAAFYRRCSTSNALLSCILCSLLTHISRRIVLNLIMVPT